MAKGMPWSIGGLPNTPFSFLCLMACTQAITPQEEMRAKLSHVILNEHECLIFITTAVSNNIIHKLYHDTVLYTRQGGIPYKPLHRRGWVHSLG